jgi:hypothetical protein
VDYAALTLELVRSTWVRVVIEALPKRQKRSAMSDLDDRLARPHDTRRATDSDAEMVVIVWCFVESRSRCQLWEPSGCDGAANCLDKAHPPGVHEADLRFPGEKRRRILAIWRFRDHKMRAEFPFGDPALK